MPCGRDPRGPPPRTCGFTCTTCGAGSAPSVSSGTLAATLSWSRRASWTPRPSVNAWSREAACSRQGTPTARPGHCASLGMWRGPAFGDLRNVDLLRAQAEHLEELRLDAVAQRIDADLILGEHHQVVNELARLAAEHPLRERFQAQLLLALYRSGRIAEALQAFDRYRRRLSADLGVEPGAELHALHLAILRDDPNLIPASLPAVIAGPSAAGPRPNHNKTERPVPRQLPGDVAGFTGRDAELAQLDALLPDESEDGTRAVVISAIAGTAGVGKTALAVRWAHRVPEGPWRSRVGHAPRAGRTRGAVQDPAGSTAHSGGPRQRLVGRADPLAGARYAVLHGGGDQPR